MKIVSGEVHTKYALLIQREESNYRVFKSVCTPSTRAKAKRVTRSLAEDWLSTETKGCRGSLSPLREGNVRLDQQQLSSLF
jgi:hypothetical protein